MSTVELRVIEEVRKWPILWDYQNIPTGRNPNEVAATWIEVGKKLDIDAAECKRIWTKLRTHFRTEVHYIPKRIARAKKNGVFDPNKKYYCWKFFDAIKFIADGRSAKAKFDLSFQNNSDMGKVGNNGIDQIESQFCNSSSYQSENYDDTEIAGCDKPGQVKSEKQQDYFGNNYESGTDPEFIESNNIYQTQSGPENNFEINILPTKSDIPRSITPVADTDGSTTEDIHFRSYTVILDSGLSDTECATVSNDNTAPQSGFFKEEPEPLIGPEKHLLENINELSHRKCFTISAAELRNCSKSGPSTLPEKHNSNSPDLTDEDYSFLYSFLSHTKVMTQLQNKEFRVNMKNLLVDIFPASASVNILEKQLLLPEDSDPERKFLISFWPFLNSMSSTKNLQFRAKMSNLVSQILSNKTIL